VIQYFFLFLLKKGGNVSIFIHRSVLGMQNTATQIKHSITIRIWEHIWSWQ